MSFFGGFSFGSLKKVKRNCTFAEIIALDLPNLFGEWNELWTLRMLLLNVCRCVICARDILAQDILVGGLLQLVL